MKQTAPRIAVSDDARSQLGDEIGNRVLRIAFTTGCGGSGYRLSFEDEPREDDVVIREAGLVIALDDMSANKLDGAVIRLSDEEEGYILDHPDAVSAVWCG